MDALEVVLSALVGAVLALTLAVALYNRPAFLVPPGLRWLPGALEEWRAAAPSPEPPGDACRPDR